jgi:Protein of unknown function (DUF3307)
MNVFTIFFALIIGHAVADYPLQGDFLAKGKNRHTAFPGIHWLWCMTMHSLIHAGAVWLITGMWVLGLAEFIAHFIVDCLKCEKINNFNEDQLAHILYKITWAVGWYFGRP